MYGRLYKVYTDGFSQNYFKYKTSVVMQINTILYVYVRPAGTATTIMHSNNPHNFYAKTKWREINQICTGV